jgi:superfamily II DNA or RNA helicase
VIRFYKGLIFISKDESEIINKINPKKYKDEFVSFPSEIVLNLPEKIKEVEGLEFLPNPNPLGFPDIRDYQKKAFEMWSIDGNFKGTIVMPTGTGKTFLAIYCICHLKLPTLCVVPTLALVDQWVQKLNLFFDEVGEWTGRAKNLKPITVATYDSASISAEFLGNKFAFLVFDEVHHLPSENYRKIAQMSVAWNRLGLTATLEREDGLHKLIPELVGSFIYKVNIKDVRNFIADWHIVQLNTKMTKEDVIKYSALMKKYRDFCTSLGLNPGEKETFLRVLRLSFRDPIAREAVSSLREAKKLAMNYEGKINVVREILKKHKGEKILIFTDSQQMAYKISETFLIPAITSEISTEERSFYLKAFSEGKITAIVSAHVLDEGIDVPEASVAVIVSGSGSPREFVQRLGRILRPSKPKALMYEIISSATSEYSTSKRRKQALYEENL